MSRGGSGTRGRDRRAFPGPTRVALAGAALLLAVAGAAGVGSTAAHPAPSSIGLSLTAQPLSGSSPLLVDLRATLTPSSLAATYNWSFGDGTFYEETAIGYSAVTHEYVLAGAFVANVSVVSTQGDADANVTIVTLPGALAASIAATPLSGPVPLTVHVDASATGGSGTLLDVLWDFGDGGNGTGPDLNYTYSAPGNFTITLSITDSAGRTASADVVVHATPSAGTHPNQDLPALSPWEAAAIPVAIVLAAVALMAVAYRWLVVRRTDSGPAATLPTTTPPATAGSEPAGPPSPEEMVAADEQRPGRDDARRLSERILVHLYWYGRSTAEGVAPPDASQSGMARRLGVAQNSLSKALGRLMDAGAVSVQLRHVPGAPRRLKTYTLTPRGEAIARSIRAQAGERKRGP